MSRTGPAWPIAEAAELAAALGARRCGRGWLARCPSCGYQGAFTVAEHAGTTLVRCHAGCAQPDVLDALRRRGLWGGRGTGDRGHGPARAAEAAAGDAAPAAERARALWDRATLAGLAALAAPDPVGCYLARRGYAGPIPPVLRYLPVAEHKPTGTRWPAMLAAVTRGPSAAVVAVHRTFLRPDGAGKAPVEPARMTLGPVAGGAVRLAEAGGRLAVVEGIETGLSVLAATAVPTWAALSAGGIRRLVLPPPPLAAEVTICADHDPVGLAAAYDAAERWHHEGRRVRIARPPRAGCDFNDLLLAAGGGEP
jgi:putative DNA primase/helicase